MLIKAISTGRHAVRKAGLKLIITEERATAKLRYLPRLKINHDKRQKHRFLLCMPRSGDRKKHVAVSRGRRVGELAQPLKEQFVKLLPKFSLW